MKNHYLSRPFMVRNADEFDLFNILNLFANPIEGIIHPFEFENSIIKGRMGSGKTMYLRANYAFHLYNLVPRLIDDDQIILPVFIKLSDFNQFNDNDEIYKGIIIKIIDEISNVYLKLQDAKYMASLHLGMKSISEDILFSHKLSESASNLIKLKADEYVEKVESEIGATAKAQHKFFEASANYKKTKGIEVSKSPNPSILDVEEAYKILLEDINGKVLFLIDETGSLNKDFFKSNGNNSHFEVLMNQLRTTSFCRTKIAIYPNSHEDILTETRYGSIVSLEKNIFTINGYQLFRKQLVEIIRNYLNKDSYFQKHEVQPNDLFEISVESIYGDYLEQIIFASNGNLRRAIQLLETSMDVAFMYNSGNGKVLKKYCSEILNKHTYTIEEGYNDLEKDFLAKIGKKCKSRSTFKFQFPYQSAILNKYTNRSQEYNLVNIIEVGTGKKSTTYAFDYSYCVSLDIPTHIHNETKKIDYERSYAEGHWISKITKISEQTLRQAEIPGRIKGKIIYLSKENSNGEGTVLGEDNNEYYISKALIIDDDFVDDFEIGMEICFFPTITSDTLVAYNIEKI